MGKIMKGITFGAIIGFAAGLLFAPLKGEDARKKAQEAIEKGKEKLKEIQGSFTKEENK